MFTENCPDHNPSLSSWSPGHQPQKAVVVRKGQLFRLEASATFLLLTIQSGGKDIKSHDLIACGFLNFKHLWIMNKMT